MNKPSISQHISRKFNAELEDLRQRVLLMGGLVERQTRDAIKACVEGDTVLAQQVIETDHQVNGLEVYIDESCSRILARRQPTASDLRLIVAIIKTITDLERIGDEAEKICKMVEGVGAATDREREPFFRIEQLGESAALMIRDALDAFARMDVEKALAVAQADARLDREYRAIIRQCMTYMMEDPRTIRDVMDVMWALRSIERIGDHAKNLAEYVIYFVQGKDVRHISLEALEQEVKNAASGK